MKVLGLISARHDPASRLRIVQYAPLLDRHGIDLHPYLPLPSRNADPPAWAYGLQRVTRINPWRSWDAVRILGRLPLLLKQGGYDLIWQNRLVMPHYSFYERRLKRPVVFDFDDAIWLHEGAEAVHDKLGRSQAVFAGNEFLADYALRYNRQVHVVPTTVDTDRLRPMNTSNAQFTIGWIGTAGNIRYLEPVLPALRAFLSRYPDARFMLISSHPPSWFPARNAQWSFRSWQVERENDWLNECAVGLMPLEDSEWSKGKCSYKLLQYMACGLPSVFSPVGTNGELLAQAPIGLPATEPSDWLEALVRLKEEPALAHYMGTEARKLAETRYATSAWAPRIAELLKLSV